VAGASTTRVSSTPLQVDVDSYCDQLTDRAVAASRSLFRVEGEARTAALVTVSQRILDSADAIIAANGQDWLVARDSGLAEPMLKRLRVDRSGVEKMAESVRLIAGQADPVGQVIDSYTRPNGLRIEKVRVPIGVVLIIYESRPNVTSDAAALCLKSGNAVILRGGKEATHTNVAIARCLAEGLEEAGLSSDCVQLVATTDRQAVGRLLRQVGKIDVVIPRGGESLIKAVVEQAHIPVIKHYTGNCHVYVDGACDDEMALNICVNAKTQYTAVCNAAESILIHTDAVQRGLLERICRALADKGCQIRGDEATRRLFPASVAANESDWSAEYLDLIVAMRVVSDVEQAIDHINRYGSKHTDAIITNSVSAADDFVQGVDSANVFVNCSTRFSDGGEYGLGAEIGISTDKLHARGPMGAADLTTYKWVVRGTGQLK